MLLHERRDVVPAPLGHPDVGEDDVRPVDRNPRDRLIAVTHGDDVDVLPRKCQLDDALDGEAAVGQQELVSH
jgi:hypothetical protein